MVRLTLLSPLLAACFLLPAGAQAAQDNGHAYPCTKDFAKTVAIDSNFDDLAAQSNPNFSSTQFWVAIQVFCADFDQDGSDEMAIVLGAMGGNSPWAFFDVPDGNSASASYTYPVISGGRYPNHELAVVSPAGKPQIRDTRRLFRKFDAHCCPTGGKQVRTIGYVNGSYQVLSESTTSGSKKPQTRFCNDPRGSVATNLLARALGCPGARRLAASYARRTVKQGRVSGVLGRLRCSHRRPYATLITIKCRKAKTRLTFDLELKVVQCGDDKRKVGAGWGNVKALLVGCHRARELANNVFFHPRKGDHYGGFTCSRKALGPEFGSFKCRDGLRRVTFQAGA